LLLLFLFAWFLRRKGKQPELYAMLVPVCQVCLETNQVMCLLTSLSMV
jgi:hypothetical protein